MPLNCTVAQYATGMALLEVTSTPGSATRFVEPTDVGSGPGGTPGVPIPPWFPVPHGQASIMSVIPSVAGAITTPSDALALSWSSVWVCVHANSRLHCPSKLH